MKNIQFVYYKKHCIFTMLTEFGRPLLVLKANEKQKIGSELHKSRPQFIRA